MKQHKNSKRESEQGVVLVITLITLLLIALLAASGMRNAGSAEQVLGSVRTTVLAREAAEAALRFCEESVENGGSVPILNTGATEWTNIDTWDGADSAVFVLPVALLNEAELTETYRRMPECLVEMIPPTTLAYIITARGFGPEVQTVVTGESRRPDGTEIWLQSHIELE
jgi:type IV pilus assembly protein PilX